MKKTALVLGGGGFIGSHLVRRLKSEGLWVRAVDLKFPEFSETVADDFVKGDLRDPNLCKTVIDQKFDEIYQLAADMGGAGFIFTGENDADVMHNSALININVLDASLRRNSKNIFYSSSACIYPEHNKIDPDNPNCEENSAYPANPDSEYGWEKLFSERLYFSYARNYGFNCKVARYHNIFGPQGTWVGGREKAPAAICRKVALAKNGDEIEIWGDGEQTRTFLFVDDCVEGTLRLFNSNHSEPTNIGSDEQVSINQMADIIEKISGIKNLKRQYLLDKPKGVRGRSSDNTNSIKALNWKYTISLNEGLTKTYSWILSELKNDRSNTNKFCRS